MDLEIQVLTILTILRHKDFIVSTWQFCGCPSLAWWSIVHLESKVGDLQVGGEDGHFDLAGIVLNIYIHIYIYLCFYSHTVYIYIYVCYRLFIHNVDILLRVMGVESPCLSTSHNKVIENRTIFIDICLQQWLTQKKILALFWKVCSFSLVH